MPEVPDDDHDVEEVERIAADADVLKTAWQETIDQMKDMAADLEDDGWDVHYVAAGDTAPEPPDAGTEDRWGLVHVIPDNYADGVEEFIDRGRFPKYDVYRAEQKGRVFLLTVLFDPETSSALLVAGQFELRKARGLVVTAKDAETMYTHLQTIDGTVRGSFEHEQPEKFFPHYEDFEEQFTRPQ